MIVTEVDERAQTQVGCAVFVMKENSFLILRRASEDGNGLWSLPGGKIELHETWQHAGAREVREETGLEIECPRLVAVTNTLPPADSWLTVWGIARLAGGKLRPRREEASDSAWVTAVTLHRYSLWDTHWDRLFAEVGSGMYLDRVLWTGGA